MASTLPVLDSRFQRDRVTMTQINNFEEAAINGLRRDRRPFSDRHRELLAGRRARPVARDTARILAALQANQTIVVASPTGSGKTTEIPQLAMFNELGTRFLVACTQPRRLAATSVAEFVAKQRDVELGEEVGYKVRFDNKTMPTKTRLQYMTDGMLLQEIQADHILSRYGCIIIDEAHERSLSTEVLLALLRDVLGQRRDLKLIIMSATIDAMKFRSFFKGPGGQPAPYLEIGGASYPVKIAWGQSAGNAEKYLEITAKAVSMLHRTKPIKGDILVFLPGEDEIGAVLKCLKNLHGNDMNVIPVYSLLADEQQQQVFKTVEGVRKVVLATNIAETSLTIDGIVYVVDCGKSKQTAFQPRTRCELLTPLPISRASAMQRTGRAGRTGPGECYRVYTQSAWRDIMEDSTVPEIKRSDLTEMVLRLMAMGGRSVKDVWNFEFVDQPDPEVLIAAFEDLIAMEFLNDEGIPAQLRASNAVQFPVYPGWYRAMVKANGLQCIDAVVSLAAVLSTQASIFFRPKSLKAATEQVHRQFWHPLSDHLAALNAFNAYKHAEEEGQPMSMWCNINFINHKSVQEARQLEGQLIEVCKRLGFKKYDTDLTAEAATTNIRKAIAFGFCHRAAIVKDATEGIYMQSHRPLIGALDPNSCLNGAQNPVTDTKYNKYEWIVYDKFVRRPQAYFQTATVIELDWLMDLPYFQDNKMPALSHSAKKMQPVIQSRQRLLARRASNA